MSNSRACFPTSLQECPSEPSRDWPVSEEHFRYAVTRRGTSPLSTDWVQGVRDLISPFQERMLSGIEHSVTLAHMETRIAALEKAMPSLTSGTAISVPIQSLAPEPCEILKPFQVVVTESDGEYIACFYDANLSASGDTSEEAVLNLKDTIVAVFEMLNSTCPENLGPGPTGQIAVLREFIRER